jgi:hypothetical protein
MKIICAAAVAAFMSIPMAADAGPREDLVDGVAKCATVTDNTARLACYDALTPVVKAAEAAPPAPSPPAPTASAAPGDATPWYDPFHVFGTSPSQQVRPEQFGAENLAPPPPPPGQPAAAPAEPLALDNITAGVSDYSFNPFGKFVVFLDNGQIWRQLDGDGGKAHFKPGKNAITISRGILDTYDLTVNDGVATFKVKRVK